MRRTEWIFTKADLAGKKQKAMKNKNQKEAKMGQLGAATTRCAAFLLQRNIARTRSLPPASQLLWSSSSSRKTSIPNLK